MLNSMLMLICASRGVSADSSLSTLIFIICGLYWGWLCFLLGLGRKSSSLESSESGFDGVDESAVGRLSSDLVSLLSRSSFLMF